MRRRTKNFLRRNAKIAGIALSYLQDEVGLTKDGNSPYINFSLIEQKQLLRTHTLVGVNDTEEVVDYLYDEDACPGYMTKPFRRHNKKVLKDFVRYFNAGYTISSKEMVDNGRVDANLTLLSRTIAA